MRHSTRSPVLQPPVLALAALTILCTACGVGDESRQTVTVRTEMVLERVAVGSAIQDDGSIAVGQESRAFTVGDTVHVSFEPDPEAPATEVELVWYGPDGLEAGSDLAATQPDQTHVPFATDTTAWPPGTYRGEVWYGNELVEELEVELAAAGS